MPSQRQGSLQKQGVPIPSKLEGPSSGKQQRATQTRRTSTPQRQNRPRVRQNRSRAYDAAAAGAGVEAARRYSPTRYADKTSSGVGLLEAEYFGIIFILVAGLIFGSDNYGNKMMAFMKRGFLTSILFFFLALVAGIGPNAAKITKGLGALVFIAILVSTPGQDIIYTIDNFFKQSWVGTGETAGEGGTKSSSDSGTSTSTGVLGDIESTLTTIGGAIINPGTEAGLIEKGISKLRSLLP